MQDKTVPAVCLAGGGRCSVVHFIPDLSTDVSYEFRLQAVNRYGVSELSFPLLAPAGKKHNLVLTVTEIKKFFYRNCNRKFK